MQIHCHIVNQRVNSKQCGLHCLKRILKSFEERGVQKSAFQDNFKTNQIAGSDDYGKLLQGNIGSLKIMSNESH